MKENIQIELTQFKSRVQAVRNYLQNDLKGLGPTSRAEVKDINDLLDMVVEVGEKTVTRRRLK